jgi:hypothetical protein
LALASARAERDAALVECETHAANLIGLAISRDAACHRDCDEDCWRALYNAIAALPGDKP